MGSINRIKGIIFKLPDEGNTTNSEEGASPQIEFLMTS
jgi:hypothetical protein